jgi:hypothetical protein
MGASVLHPDFQEHPVAGKLYLRRDQLAKFRNIRGDSVKTDAKFAKAIGVHPAQVSRVLSGACAPGTSFVVGCLKLFGGVDYFGDLFAIDDGTNGNGGEAVA